MRRKETLGLQFPAMPPQKDEMQAANREWLVTGASTDSGWWVTGRFFHFTKKETRAVQQPAHYFGTQLDSTSRATNGGWRSTFLNKKISSEKPFGG